MSVQKITQCCSNYKSNIGNTPIVTSSIKQEPVKPTENLTMNAIKSIRLLFNNGNTRKYNVYLANWKKIVNNRLKYSFDVCLIFSGKTYILAKCSVSIKKSGYDVKCSKNKNEPPNGAATNEWKELIKFVNECFSAEKLKTLKNGTRQFEEIINGDGVFYTGHGGISDYIYRDYKDKYKKCDNNEIKRNILKKASFEDCVASYMKKNGLKLLYLNNSGPAVAHLRRPMVYFYDNVLSVWGISGNRGLNLGWNYFHLDWIN